MTADCHPPDSAEDATEVDEVWDRRCKLRYHLWVQLRYNRRRQRFFDLVDKLTKSITLLLGASLFGKYFQDRASVVATAISAIGLLALVFGYGDRKQLHKDLSEQAGKVIEDIEAVPPTLVSDVLVAQWTARYVALLSKSPPPLKNLTLICEHEQSVADGERDHVKLPFFLFRGWVAHII